MEAEPETKVVKHDSKVTAELPSADSIDPSATIGRYQLVQRLGHGGMATVYLGRAEGKGGFEKLVAIKVIHPHLANEPDFVEMFLDEARIAARIHHPHVVEILDLGEADGLSFMVMEYVEGDTLSSVIRSLRGDGEYLPLPVVTQIVTDACEGIGAAHELVDPDGQSYNLVHRDVSPQNLLVGLDGRVKVVDFGIMKAAGKRSNTLTGQLRGKLPYMSPEQARGEKLDHRTDLFALGTILWELLTNERVFQGGSEAKTIDNVTACRIPDIGEKRPDIPPGLRKVLDRAVAAKPEDRYESAEAMLSDLRAVMRRFSADEDPRRRLASIMRRRFGAKAEYARAAARAGASTSANVVPFQQTPAPHEPTLQLSVGSGSISSRSNAQPQTLTTSLATAPARHWTLWLLLPLLGAALGTAVVTWNGDAPPESGATPAQLPAPAKQTRPVPEPKPHAPVKWLFNTDPQGATVTVAGKPHGPTPIEIDVPHGEEAVTVRIDLPDHEPKEMRLAPLKSDNYHFALSPIPSEEPTSGPRRHKFVAPTKEVKPPSASPKNDEPKKSDGRTFDPLPDFDNLAGGGPSAAGG